MEPQKNITSLKNWLVFQVVTKQISGLLSGLLFDNKKMTVIHSRKFPIFHLLYQYSCILIFFISFVVVVVVGLFCLIVSCLYCFSTNSCLATTFLEMLPRGYSVKTYMYMYGLKFSII